MNIDEDDIAQMKRGLSWVDLKQSLEIGGCPICNTMQRSIEKYFNSLLWEYALDVSVHTKNLASFGMCNTHTYMLKEAEKTLGSDGLNIAVLYETIMQKEIKLLKNLSNAGLVEEKDVKEKEKKLFNFSKSRDFESYKKEMLSELIGKGICIGCSHLEFSESFNTHEIVRLYKDEEFRNIYENVEILLCRRHFLYLINESWNKEALDYFIDIQKSKIIRLFDKMSGFINKHDYRLKSQMTDEESKSWEIVLEYTGSKQGINKEGYNNLLI